MDKRKEPGYNPKVIGERTEAQILAAFLMDGRVVLMPYGDSQRYDLVVEENGQFIRVQCKTGKIHKDKLGFEFPTASSNWNTRKKRGYKGQADIFATLLPETKEIFIFNVSDVPSRACCVRFEKPKNNRMIGIRLAKDYEYDSKRSLLSYFQ